MPQAALVAGIGAAAQLGGAVIGSRSSRNAQKEQLKANQEALNYERQREAKAEQQRLAARAAYEKSWNEWAARVGDEGIWRYGVPVGFTYPGSKSAAPAPSGPAIRMPGSSVEPAPGAPAPGALGASSGSLGSMMGAPVATAQAPMAQMEEPEEPQANLGSLGNWQDWSRYV